MNFHVSFNPLFDAIVKRVNNDTIEAKILAETFNEIQKQKTVDLEHFLSQEFTRKYTTLRDLINAQVKILHSYLQTILKKTISDNEKQSFIAKHIKQMEDFENPNLYNFFTDLQPQYPNAENVKKLNLSAFEDNKKITTEQADQLVEDAVSHEE